MSYYDKIKKIKAYWEYPSETMQVVEVNDQTDAEGSIILNYDNITEVTTSNIDIYKAIAPQVPVYKYTREGSDLYTGTEFDLNSIVLSQNRVKLNWKFNTNILTVEDGDFYIVSIAINDLIKIDFIIKIVNVEV